MRWYWGRIVGLGLLLAVLGLAGPVPAPPSTGPTAIDRDNVLDSLRTAREDLAELRAVQNDPKMITGEIIELKDNPKALAEQIKAIQEAIERNQQRQLQSKQSLNTPSTQPANVPPGAIPQTFNGMTYYLIPCN